MKYPVLLPRGRMQLVKVINTAGDVIHIADVATALRITRVEAAKRLARWTEQGWLRRVSSGTYVPASLETLGETRVLDDPWVLVPALYSPGYVAGRTAAEHWDLTEQIFKDVVVITARHFREKNQERHGVSFSLKHLGEDKIFGTTPVWRHRSKVLVSDVHRTIVDIVSDPSIGGGIQHVSDCIGVYLTRRDRDDNRLIQYADQLGNGAVFKRLGFLAERNPKGSHLAELCLPRLSAGNAKLDPALDGPRYVSRWRLRIPETWDVRGRS
jgi:predicted transcriptional regulator of viral defense system